MTSWYSVNLSSSPSLWFMFATLPRAIQHYSETSWASSTESALVGILRTLAHQAFDQCHTTSDRMILTSTTAQHVFNGRFRTYTANLQRPTISECPSLLPAAWRSVPTVTLWELLHATTLLVFSGITFDCSISLAMPTRCRCLGPPRDSLCPVAISYALRHSWQSGAGWRVQES